MLKRTPTVYVPIEPEDNGVALPAVLSMVVHVAIVAFIIFFHHVPKVKTPATIDTSIISPEELASIQADIIANREALAASAAQLANNAESVPTENTTTQTTTVQNTTSNTPSVIHHIPIEIPTFSNYDETLLSDVDIESSVNNKTEIIKRAENKAEENLATTPQPITNPAPNQANSNSYMTDHDLGGNNNPINAKNTTHGGGSSIDSVSGAIKNLIYKAWSTPKNKKGVSVDVVLKLDANGNVLHYDIATNDQALRASLEAAINSAAPFTPVIGTSYRTLNLHFIAQ